MIPSALGVALAAGCTPAPEETPRGPVLTSGAYTRTAESVDPSSCAGESPGSPFHAQFASVAVDVADTRTSFAASFDGGAFETTYEILGTGLRDPRAPGHTIVDLRDPEVAVEAEGFATTFDCVIDAGVTWVGVVTSDDRFTLSDVFTLDVVSGADCGLVQLSSGVAALPCADSANTSWAL